MLSLHVSYKDILDKLKQRVFLIENVTAEQTENWNDLLSFYIYLLPE